VNFDALITRRLPSSRHTQPRHLATYTTANTCGVYLRRV
jgi:hypothetical protein